MKETLKTLISDFVDAQLPELVEREIRLPQKPQQIVSLVGARRTGKTFLMFSLIQQLRKTMPAHSLVYLNLEDDRLHGDEILDISLFRDAYYELYPQNIDIPVYWNYLHPD